MQTPIILGDLWSIKLILWLKEYFLTGVGLILAIWIIRPLASYLIQLFFWLVYLMLFIPYTIAYVFLIIFNLLPNSVVEKCSGFITFCERKLLAGVHNTQNSLLASVKKVNANVVKAHVSVKKLLKIAVILYLLVTALALINDVFFTKHTTLDQVMAYVEQPPAQQPNQPPAQQPTQ